MAGLACIILAGGFARRLLPLTENTPKPLLPVGGKPILSYTVEKLLRLPELGECYITTNRKFRKHFSGFIQRECRGLDARLFVEDADSEGQKLGSVGALAHLVSTMRLEGDCLVLGGDNLLGFELRDFVAFQRARGGSALALHDVGSLEKASLYGIARLGEGSRIVDFVEKPRVPPSTLASTACYLFTSEAMASLATYLAEGNSPDAAGHFVAWLVGRLPVFGFRAPGPWFDIGSLESLREADELFSRKGPA